MVEPGARVIAGTSAEQPEPQGRLPPGQVHDGGDGGVHVCDCRTQEPELHTNVAVPLGLLSVAVRVVPWGALETLPLQALLGPQLCVCVGQLGGGGGGGGDEGGVVQVLDCSCQKPALHTNVADPTGLVSHTVRTLP